MNFNSHTDSAVAGAVALVNAVTPGERQGRPYPGPSESALPSLVRVALGERMPIDAGAAESLAAAAARLRTVFVAVDAGDLDQAATTVNGLLDDYGARPHLQRHDGEPWHLHFHGDDAGAGHGWAAGLATALAVVLGGDYADRLGVCQASGCDRVFVDVSRNGTRRFCSTTCQNRVKAAAYRARRP